MAARDLAESPARGPLSGRYRSLFVIGRGGMGAVEAALELHGEGYERVVALKRLLPDAARDARRVEMFLREARLAAMLDHPNVVRAYDFGELEGELFLAMEYVEGQALSRVLRALSEGKAALGAALTAHVLAEVCDGLHAAHELKDEAGQPLNLVHRDVSPQNVMIGYDGHVRLLDFGVAKIEAESVTKTGEVKGKTAYMSPEQAMGDAIDRRSDLFGVGAVLFECLALRRMWGDGTDMDVIRKLALEQPPKLEDAVPDLPPELCALYKQLVARDAKDRPSTAREVAEALRTHVPQGREEAARELKQLLDAHFGDQAAEQSRRLTSSLEEVAPDQARELRESMSPDHLPAPVSTRVPAVPSAARSATTASVADATGSNPALDASTLDGDRDGERERRGAGVAASSRDGRPWLWFLLAAVVGGVVIWRLTGTSTSTSTSASTSASTSTSTSASASTSTSSAVTPVATPLLPSASVVPSGSPAPTVGSAPRPVVRVLAQPTPVVAPVVSSNKPPATPAPPTSKPLNVDKTPF